MTANRPVVEEGKGVRRLAVGAGLGLAGGLLAVVIPLGIFTVNRYDPGTPLALTPTVLEVIGILLVTGGILFLLSFFVYRRAFAHLRRFEERFWAPSALCLVGSVGFVLLIVASLVVIGSSSSLVSCVQGKPTAFVSCLRSSQPLGAYTGLIGFWMGWVGGFGLVLGTVLSGSRFREGTLTAAGALYALLLLVFIGPFLVYVTEIPGAAYALLAAPFLVVLAPALAFAGSYRAVESLPKAAQAST